MSPALSGLLRTDVVRANAASHKCHSTVSGPETAVAVYEPLNLVAAPAAPALPPLPPPAVKFGLHYGDYRSKLAPFKEQKKIFYILKRL